MIQILGLRKYTTGGVEKLKDAFFSQGWRLPSIEGVFDDAARAAIIEAIPENERYNIYFTVAQCFEQSKRVLKEQWAVPFDIDNIHLPEGCDVHEEARRVATVVCEALGVDYDKTGVIFSGHGVQLFIRTMDPIIEEEYFDKFRVHYGVLADRIQRLLDERGIAGEVDKSVWCKGRLMRFPDTENIKAGKVQRTARVLQSRIVEQLFTVPSASGVDVSMDKDDLMLDQELTLYNKPDTPSVLKECGFLQWCAAEPSELSEPQWYAMTSITARLEDGRALTHTMSAGHPSYSHYETDNKVDQALAAAGPRTCKNISQLWDGCRDCQHFGKIKSPIVIKGPDFIATRDGGFRSIRITEQGPKPGKPAYADIVKAFKQMHPYKTITDADEIVIYNGKYWEYRNRRQLSAWLTSIIRPEPTMQEKAEAIEMIKSFELTNLDEMRAQRNGMLNFQNCVLNTITMETHPHHPSYGFFEILPYAYDPRAVAPRWNKFINEITDGNEAKAQILREFAGYCISGDEYWLHKALILMGGGSNGKSVYMEVLGALVGEENYSSVPIQDMERSTSRVRMLHKLFNYSEETSTDALRRSSVFKTITAGGKIFMKQLYAQEFMAKSTAKIIASCNDMLVSGDDSYGLLRRLLIVTFNRTFIPGSEGYDPNIKAKLLMELPGICNDVLSAYQDLKKRGNLSDSALAVNTLAVDSFRENNSPVLRFVEDSLILGEEHWTNCRDLMAEYIHWCEMNAVRPENDAWFFRKLYKVPGIEQVKKNGIRGVSGCKIRREDY